MQVKPVKHQLLIHDDTQRAVCLKSLSKQGRHFCVCVCVGTCCWVTVCVCVWMDR